MASSPKCPLLPQLATVLLLLAPFLQFSQAMTLGAPPLNSNMHQIFHQVAIRVRQPVMDKTEDYHLCSGLIVDTFFVVTSAKCLQMRPIDPVVANGSEIYVAAGHLANDDTANQMNYTIVQTFIHPEFYNIDRHDIALIKVLERLPATAIVAIPSVQDSANNCSVIIRNHDATSPDYFKLVTNMRIAPDRYCSAALAATAVDDDDYYCSEYPLDNTWCTTTVEQLRTSGDLGAALICNNVFMGVLSEIQFPYDQFNFPCNQPRTTFGLFTSLDEHREWLYVVMGRHPMVPTDPDMLDDDDNAATMQQSIGLLMITAAVFIYFFL